MDDRTSEKKQNNPRSGNNNGSKSKSNNKRPPPPRPVQVSKKIAWLLRHGAEKEHLTLDSAGFANVHDVLENRNLKSLKVTFDELRACVRENDKQRFTLKLKSKSDTNGDDDEDDDEKNEKESKNPSDYLIRANQGHSLKKIIQDQELLQPITATEENNIPAMAIHGTTKNAWKLIVASGGLKPMGRNHIHFAPGLPAGFDKDNKSSEATTSTTTTTTIDDDDDDDGEEKEEKEKEKEKEIPVISGIRASSKILIYLDLAKAMQAGIKFWRSDNGVILSEGDENGLISMHFFQRVEDRTKEGGGAILIRDGKLSSGEASAVSNT